MEVIRLDLLDAILGRQVTYFVASAVMVYGYYEEFALTGQWGLAAYIIVTCIFLLMIWAPKTWWNPPLYIIATLLVVFTALALHFLQPYGPPTIDLLWPLAWLLAIVPKSCHAVSISLFTFVLVVVVVLSHIYPFPWLKLLTLVGIYMGIRSRKIRQEALYLNVQHLQELDEAHQKLQQAHTELLEASAESMRYAALAERTRLAREIHDGIGHHLTSLIVQLQAIQMMLPHDGEMAAQVIPDMLSVARQGMGEIRAAVREWASDETGLGLIALKGLLSQTEANSNLQCEFIQAGDISDWPRETGVALYRILQESLTNIMRHAKATSVAVTVKESNNEVTLTIADDGQYTGDPLLTPAQDKGRRNRMD